MKELIKFKRQLLDEAFELSDRKGQDYRIGSQLVHQNFINVGKDLNLEPIVVLGVYMKKHFDAIENYIKTGGQSESEPIRERVKDAINYIILGAPLSLDDHMSQDEYEKFRVEYVEEASRSFLISPEFDAEVGLESLSNVSRSIPILSEYPPAFYRAGKAAIVSLIYWLFLEELDI